MRRQRRLWFRIISCPWPSASEGQNARAGCPADRIQDRYQERDPGERGRRLFDYENDYDEYDDEYYDDEYADDTYAEDTYTDEIYDDEPYDDSEYEGDAKARRNMPGMSRRRMPGCRRGERR